MRQEYRVYTVEKIKSICIINTAEQEIELSSTPSFVGHKGFKVSLKLCLNL